MRTERDSRPSFLSRCQLKTERADSCVTCVYAVVVLPLSLIFSCIFPQRVDAAQPLETETARLVEAGSLRMESTFEFQTSSQGKACLVPLAFTYGLRNDLELVIEPVVSH